ncbi:MAG: gephyrin-like molybdotransferase Glp [Candidatus Binatia bacterium]
MNRFLTLIRTEDALEQLAVFPPGETEEVDARRACGRVAAADIRAPTDVPSFARSNMDGFAVVAADLENATESTSVTLRVSGQVAMGEAAVCAVERGCAARISTGGMMPDGADSVVIHEHTESLANGTVLVRTHVAPGENVVLAGEDMRRGELIFSPGRRFKGGDVGALTGMGLDRVSVYRRPTVGVIVSGDEIVEPGTRLEPGQVYNANEHALASLVRRCGAQAKCYGVIPDDETRLLAAFERAVADNDVVLVSGGSSKGPRDLTRRTIESLPDANVLFHGVAIAPGKPTILARVGSTAVMGLPGNPAAVVVVFTILCSTLIRIIGGEILGQVLATRPFVRARLLEDKASTPGREDYVRVKITPGDPVPVVTPLAGKSVAMSTIARADGLMRIPRACEGVRAGETVDVLLLD